MGRQRLQKIIAAAGVTSRRKAETLVVEGRVAVNGEVVRELGGTADPDVDLVTLDGRPLERERLRYFLVHKPAGVLCAVRDDRGRRLVVDLLPDDVSERLFPAGRLDLDSEGLVLLTNDGDMMQSTTRPGGDVAKVYEVVVGGSPAAPGLESLRDGVELDGRRLMPCRIEVLERIEPADRGAPGVDERGFTRLQVTLHEGKKNQIRRMFQGIGHRVVRLRRLAIGPLALGSVAEGEVRELEQEEVLRLRQAGERAAGGRNESESGAAQQRRGAR